MRLTDTFRHGRRLAAIALLLQLTAASSYSQGQPSVLTLEWDPNSESVAGYRVHVGTRSGDYPESFDVGGSTTFVYAMAVRGRRYYFAVSAYASDGQSSALSSEVSAVAPASAPRPPEEELPESPEGESVNALDDARATAQPAQAICSGDGSCFDVRARATGLSPVSTLSAADDGTLFWVEGGRDVRLLGTEATRPQAALTAADNSHIAEVVPAPGFAAEPWVNVGVVHAIAGALPQFSAIRYRVARARLIEPLVAVSRVPIVGAGDPRMAVDRSHRLYLAMPGDGDTRVDPYAGRLLRFNADGTVPSENRAASPILAYGHATPLAMRVDEQHLVIAGISRRGSHVLSRLALDAPSASEWPATPTAIVEMTRTVTSSAMTAGLAAGSRATRAAAVRELAYIDADGQLAIVDLETGAERRLELRIDDDALVPEAVAFGAEGRLYLAARRSDGTSGVFELTPSR